MWKFYHNQLQLLTSLHTELTNSISAYHKNDYHYDSKLNAFIQNMLDWCESNNKMEILSEVLIIASELRHASKGLDPLTYKKITTGRNDFKRIYFLKSTTSLDQILRNALAQIHDSILTATNDLTQLVLASIQSGALDINAISDMDDESANAYWKNLNGSNDVTAVKARITTQVGRPDITLILLNLFSKISSGLD